MIGAADDRLVEQHSGQPLGGAVQRTTASWSDAAGDRAYIEWSSAADNRFGTYLHVYFCARVCRASGQPLDSHIYTYRERARSGKRFGTSTLAAANRENGSLFQRGTACPGIWVARVAAGNRFQRCSGRPLTGKLQHTSVAADDRSDHNNYAADHRSP